MESRLDNLYPGNVDPNLKISILGEYLRLGSLFIVIGSQIIEVHQQSKKGFELLMHPHQINNKNQPMPTKVKGIFFLGCCHMVLPMFRK